MQSSPPLSTRASATRRFLKAFLAPVLLLALAVSCGGNSTTGDADRVSADVSLLDVGYATGDSATSVTKSVTLPTAGAAGASSITWASSNAYNVSTKGVVNRPPYGADAPVTLTATLNYGTIQTTKTFDLTVKQVPTIQFIFHSDNHFGDVTKPGVMFQGSTNVDSFIVNGKMRDVMNTLPSTLAPSDYGVGAGLPFGNFDFIAQTGDIGSKSVPIPDSNGNSATVSFGQFKTIYLDGITLKNNTGAPIPHYMTYGNHEIGNALGGPDLMVPAKDAAGCFEIYNRMMSPATPLTAATFDYNQHKIFAPKVIGGIHFIFLNYWLDAEMLEKLTAYIATVPATTPVMLFMHTPPEQEGKSFRDPASNGTDFPWAGGYANYFRDKLNPLNIVAPATTLAPTTVPLKEVTAVATFLKAHTNIVAWFHGHDNFTMFRTWNGENSVDFNANDKKWLSIPVFRVDSPMKGKDAAAKDYTKASFQVITIDPVKKEFTVRECLWNKTNAAGISLGWGMTETFPLTNRVR